MEQEALAAVTLPDLLIRAAQARRIAAVMAGDRMAMQITQYAEELDVEIRRRREGVIGEDNPS